MSLNVSGNPEWRTNCGEVNSGQGQFCSTLGLWAISLSISHVLQAFTRWSAGKRDREYQRVSHVVHIACYMSQLSQHNFRFTRSLKLRLEQLQVGKLSCNFGSGPHEVWLCWIIHAMNQGISFFVQDRKRPFAQIVQWHDWGCIVIGPFTWHLISAACRHVDRSSKAFDRYGKSLWATTGTFCFFACKYRNSSKTVLFAHESHFAALFGSILQHLQRRFPISASAATAEASRINLFTYTNLGPWMWCFNLYFRRKYFWVCDTHTHNHLGPSPFENVMTHDFLSCFVL
jgi:hypothetical protein